MTRWLASVTMYRLVLGYLGGLTGLATVFGWFGWLPISGWDLFFQTVLFVGACSIFNRLFAIPVKVAPNPESAIITALILTLIVGPLSPQTQGAHFLIVIGAAALAMASKYVLVWRRRHIFNPAALAVLVMGLAFGQGASWWVGQTLLAPFIILGGIFVVRKIRREAMVATFLLTLLVVHFCVLAVSPATRFVSWADFGFYFWNFALVSPLFFMATIMLVEPLTSPTRHRWQLVYAVIVALVNLIFSYTTISLGKHVLASYSFEIALLAGNIFALLVRGDERYTLTLKKKTELADGIWGFWFESATPIKHTAGQFLEWSLPHPHPDSRGSRRYFTIASSPTESETLLAVRIPDAPSSFKRTLHDLPLGQLLTAAGLGGDFVLPHDTNQPLVFIAGGIGVTPFRSMIAWVVANKQTRHITLFYSARTPKEFAFTELFNQAKKYGVTTVYTVTEPTDDTWGGETGYVDAAMLQKHAPNLRDALVYVSGPEPMVESFEILLTHELKLKKSQLRQDFFPGYTETHRAS